jgi:hypothetical protein
MEKRKCFNCGEHIPPETEHFSKDGDSYCKDCVEVKSYTAYVYYIGGEYLGDSGEDIVQHIEDYEDDYEEES